MGTVVPGECDGVVGTFEERAGDTCSSEMGFKIDCDGGRYFGFKLLGNVVGGALGHVCNLDGLLVTSLLLTMVVENLTNASSVPASNANRYDRVHTGFPLHTGIHC